MRLLLDTHTFIWLVSMTNRLRPETLAMLRDPTHEILFSAASAWEMAIKAGKGKLRLPLPPSMYIPQRMAEHDLLPLPIEHRHALAVTDLPHHHGDPFDRLLIAQAIVEGIPIVTVDRRLAQYDVQIIPA